ncbi:MAG: hypothetical protein ABI876_06530 [Bacteroidota bacterium]
MRDSIKEQEQKFIDDARDRLLDGVHFAIKQSRYLLFVITMLAAWLLAVQIQGYIEWGPTRAVFSQTIVQEIGKKIMDSLHEHAWIYVTSDRLRPVDAAYERMRLDSVSKLTHDSTATGVGAAKYIPGRADSDRNKQDIPASSVVVRGRTPAKSVATIRYGVRNGEPTDSLVWAIDHLLKRQLDSTSKANIEPVVKVRFPYNGSYFEQTDWLREYHYLIERQWGVFFGRLAELAIERATITPSILPGTIIQRPSPSLPIVNIPVKADDIVSVTAIIMVAAMFWLVYAYRNIERNLEIVSNELDLSQEALNKWNQSLEPAFFFIRTGAGRWFISIAQLTYFLPYAAILWAFANDIFGFIQQDVIYSLLVRHGDPLYGGVAGLPLYENEATGIILFRLVVIGILASVLCYLGSICWNQLETARGLIVNRNQDDTFSRNRAWPCIVVITVAIIAMNITWFAVNMLAINDLVAAQGWPYAVTPVAAILFLAMSGCGVLLLAFVGRRFLPDNK